MPKSSMPSFVGDMNTLCEAKLRNLKETLRDYTPDKAMEDFAKVSGFVQTYGETFAAIGANPRLNDYGKHDDRLLAAHKTLADVRKWWAEKREHLEGHRTAARDEHVKAAHAGPTIGERELDDILARLRSFDPEQVTLLYNNASHDKQRLMEAANASVGNVPQKRADGGLVWAPLLHREQVSAAVAARAATKDPKGAARVADLGDLLEVYSHVASAAEQFIKQSLPNDRLDPAVMSDPATGKPMAVPAGARR
jgi:hypothetical protein